MPPNPRFKKKLPSRFSGQDFDSAEDERPARDGGLFLWTVIILLLIGFAIFTWIASIYTFGHPEKPLFLFPRVSNYQILSKVKKIDPPKRFELTAAPRGEFLKASQILDRYGRLTPRELEHVNETLIRNYLRNYFKLAQELVPYIVGTYNILDSYELTGADFFESGVVALAQSKETRQILLEQVFTADAKAVPALHRTLLTGLDIDLKRENELSAVLHVEKLSDGRLKVTAISILYPSYESATASGTFTLDPPPVLNVSAGLPLITSRRQDDADKKYAGFRKRAGLVTEAPQDGPPQNRLMRVERPLAVNMPPPSAVPDQTPVPAVVDIPPARPAVMIKESPASTPPVAAATPTPEPPPTPTPGAIVASSTGAWATYAPGQMPRGRLLNVKDVAGMAGADVNSERVYLQGSFVVTAAGPTKAVLRTQGAITDAIGFGGRGGNVRVIVEFPAGVRPPGVGATFSRDARCPFQITGVREEDGQVNVYVREVTRP